MLRVLRKEKMKVPTRLDFDPTHILIVLFEGMPTANIYAHCSSDADILKLLKHVIEEFPHNEGFSIVVKPIELSVTD